MICIAAIRCGQVDEELFRRKMRKSFYVTAHDLKQTLSWASALSDEDLRREARTAALGLGNTPRANRIREWVHKTAEDFAIAFDHLNAWLRDGDESSLTRFAAWVGGGEVFACTKSAFFEITGRNQRVQRTKRADTTHI
jgi:hypothetical protein